MANGYCSDYIYFNILTEDQKYYYLMIFDLVQVYFKNLEKSNAYMKSRHRAFLHKTPIQLIRANKGNDFLIYLQESDDKDKFRIGERQ